MYSTYGGRVTYIDITITQAEEMKGILLIPPTARYCRTARELQILIN